MVKSIYVRAHHHMSLHLIDTDKSVTARLPTLFAGLVELLCGAGFDTRSREASSHDFAAGQLPYVHA